MVSINQLYDGYSLVKWSSAPKTFNVATLSRRALNVVVCHILQMRFSVLDSKHKAKRKYISKISEQSWMFHGDLLIHFRVCQRASQPWSLEGTGLVQWFCVWPKCSFLRLPGKIHISIHGSEDDTNQNLSTYVAYTCMVLCIYTCMNCTDNPWHILNQSCI